MLIFMPGDPIDCRRYASRCAELAAETEEPELRLGLADLAASWSKLATALERAQEVPDKLTERTATKPI
jgi:hypothetical protein